MKTIIFDIDGTLTDMWPIEKSVLLHMIKGEYEKEIENLKRFGISETYKIFLMVSGGKINKSVYVANYNAAFAELHRMNRLPKPKAYPVVKWIKENKSRYRFVYATGGQKLETEYVLQQLGLIEFFDLKNSINKSNCRFSKKTGKPFERIKSQYPDCFLITDSQSDCEGAELAKIPYYQINPGQKLHEPFKV